MTWFEFLQNVDESVLLGLSEHRSPRLNQAMLDFTALGSVSVLTLLTTVVIYILWRQRRHTGMIRLGLAAAGALIWPRVLKNLFERARPSVVEPLAVVSDSSFPSGHTFGATVMYLSFAFLAYELSGRRAFFAIAGIVIGLVALSRMYLGVHYPSDVAAGFAVGILWALFCQRYPRPS